MPDMPKRIQHRRATGWRMPEGAMSVARPGPWGNPFIVGVDGTAAECVDLHRKMLAGLICLTSRATIEAQQKALDYARSHIGELRGKDLACWCREGAACHADTLLEIANRLTCEAA